MDDGHDLVVRTIREHAPALLRTARRHSLCADDAHDAYQRALEIFLKRASSVDPETVDRWLHVVVKHEAMAVRRARLELVGTEEALLDAALSDGAEGAEDRVLRWERLSRSAEALQRLKPQELTALWLKASGLSYAEIADRQGWTYTKVNRCVTEGRRAFLARYAGIETGAECERWAPVVAALVDGEATAEQLGAARPHLRRCAACRATVRELRVAGPGLAGVLPVLPAAAAAGASSGRLEGALRTLESAWGAVQERAGLWAVKLQGGVEAASGAKLAAVASAAVVAGGGGAVAVHGAQPPAHRAARGAQAPARTHAAPTRVALITTTPARVPAPAPHGGAPPGALGQAGGRARHAARVRALGPPGAGVPGPGHDANPHCAGVSCAGAAAGRHDRRRARRDVRVPGACGDFSAASRGRRSSSTRSGGEFGGG